MGMSFDIKIIMACMAWGAVLTVIGGPAWVIDGSKVGGRALTIGVGLLTFGTIYWIVS